MVAVRGGDVFTYIMKRENLSFPESIRYLADRARYCATAVTPEIALSAVPSVPASTICAPRLAQFYHTIAYAW